MTKCQPLPLDIRAPRVRAILEALIETSTRRTAELVHFRHPIVDQECRILRHLRHKQCPGGAVGLQPFPVI